MATSERAFRLPAIGPVSRTWAARVVGLLLGVGTWLLVATVFPLDLFPGPVRTAAASYELVRTGLVWTHLWATLSRTLWGFAGAMALGVAVGVVMGTSEFGEQFSTPYIVMGLSIPGIAWAAITTIVFGFGAAAPIVATVVTTFPYVALNVWKGVESLDAELIRMSRSFGVSRRRLLRRLILPSVAPALFTATRFGLAISWKVETNAEIFASNTGVGIRALEAFQRYQFDVAMAWGAVFVVVIVLIEFAVMRPLERRVFDYREAGEFDVLG
jgi:ABC-type nitrate/sulfonate/bicarbonate transport system permease component